MKTFQKALCVMLSILMAMSCLSAVAFAADGESFTSTLKAHSGMSNTHSAKVTLDMVDEALKEANIREEIVLSDALNLEITIDLTSINAVCGTIDDYVGILKFATVLGALVLGDLRDLDLDTWKKGMSRTGDDITIMKEFIELAEANKDLVAGICDASIDLGIFDDYIDVETLLGADGVSGIIKEALFGLVYDKDSSEFSNAYNTYKDNVDAFVYDKLLPFFIKDYLPGLTLNANSKINDLLIEVYNISFEKYIKNALTGLDFDFATAEYDELKKLDGIVKLDGKNFDLSGLTYTKDGTPVKDQINRILGSYMKNFVPGYSWQPGGYEKLRANIEGSIRYVAEKSGIIKNAQSKTIEEIGIEIALIILRNADFGAYEAGLENCKTLEDMASKLLINVAKEMKLGVEYKGNESYLVVAGDILAFWAYDNFPFTDYNGKAYRPGGGKDVFEVANYFMNYFLFDRKGAEVLGLSTSKTEEFFTKLDKLADYFGQKRSVNFNSKNFFLGTTGKKGLLDCVFTLDIAGLLDLTAIPALDKAGDVSVVEFLYKTVQYFCNNWANNNSFFPSYRDKAFTNALSNGSIANMISVLLETVENRKSAVITLLTYVVALSIEGGEETDYAIESASVNSIVSTGKELFPTATVTAGGKQLKQNTDFVVVTKSLEPGVGTATIKGIGLYSGEITRSFNITFDKVNSVSYSSTDSSVTLEWKAVPYADSYNIAKYNPSTKKFENVNTGVTGTSYTVSGLSPNSEYKFSVQAVDTLAGATEAKEITTYTCTAAVNASGVKSSSSATAIKLTWPKVTGATHYRVEQSAGSNKWTKLTETTSLSYTAGKLSAGTEYTFRFTALKKLGDGKLLASAPVTVKAKTSLATPSVKASAATSSVTLSWAKVKNAEKYVVEQYNSGKWTALKTVTGTSYTVSKLSSATEYKFRVTATSSAYAASEKGSVTVNTLPVAVKSSSVKTSSSPSSIKLSWSKVTGATHYKVEQYASKKWKQLAIVDGTSKTVSGLSGYTDYTFRITALKKLSDGSYVASAPITVKAKTKLGTTSSLKASYTDTTITLKWSKVKNADKYEVLRYTDGKWKKLTTVTGTSYTVKKLKATTSYKLAVRALVLEGKKTVYGDRKEITQYTGLKKTAGVKASSITTTSAKISWSKVSKATTYEVYAYIGGEWIKKGSSKSTSFTVKGLPSGKKTKIKVRAAAKLGGKTVYGVYSGELSVLTTVGKVSGLKASVRKTDAITLSWKKTTGATGYEVYRLIDGKWKKLGTTKKTTFTDSKSLKRGTEYKYKVRAVQKINSKTTRYGAYSSQLKAKTTIIGTVKK